MVTLYVEDEDGTIYNVEIQTTNKRNLPKRIRYYQSIIDLHILSPGANYNSLRRSYVIFICNYDPFNMGRCIYSFENRCLEAPELPLGDETAKVVVNTRGRQDDAGEALREMLRYLDTGAVTGEASRAMEDAVNNVRNSEERRREYMVMMAREMEIREEGREEGRGEGKNLLSQLYAKLFSLGRTEDAQKASVDFNYRDRLCKEFGLE